MVTPAVPVDKRAFVRCCLLFLLLTALAAAQSAEQRTSSSFERARKQPQLLLAFLHDLPKGGDLHNHLDGAIYAEDLVDFAADGSLCTDRTSSRLLARALRSLRDLYRETRRPLRLRRPRSLQPDDRRLVDAQLEVRRRIRPRSFLRHVR